jgi:hypothetical protein
MSSTLKSIFVVGCVAFFLLGTVYAVKAFEVGSTVFRSQLAPDAASTEALLGGQDAAAGHVKKLSGCILVIENSLVTLQAEPTSESMQLSNLKPGKYEAIEYVTKRTFGSEEGWFRVSDGVRTGWVANDTWHISDRTAPCP